MSIIITVAAATLALLGTIMARNTGADHQAAHGHRGPIPLWALLTIVAALALASVAGYIDGLNA